jgi:ATP-binding cassette subfamily F protein 3
VDVKARDLLGRFLFSGDDIDKPVSVLSGGERTRLALAKLLVQPVNFLCLDEPTNHLDIQSRDVLEDALVEYAGTIVLVTHDRHLIRQVADNIVEVTSGTPRWYVGDYDDYMWKKEREADVTPMAAASAPAQKTARVDKAEMRRRRAAVRKIEADIDTAHAERERLTALLADAKTYAAGGPQSKNAAKALQDAEKRIAQLEADWERLTEELGSIG